VTHITRAGNGAMALWFEHEDSSSVSIDAFSRFRQGRLPMNLDPSAFVADQTLIQGIEDRSTLVACSEERVLFCQGEDPVGLFILKSGAVTLTMTSPLGQELVSIAAAPGSLLGLPGLVGDQPYTLTAKAAAGAQLGFITREAFNSLMRTKPSLAFKVLQILAAEVRSARGALREEFAHPPRPQRRLTPSPHA
jgi:CRP-like cAMP-binding protein